MNLNMSLPYARAIVSVRRTETSDKISSEFEHAKNYGRYKKTT